MIHLTRRESSLLVLLFLLAIVHSLLYMAIIPPWQVPDEPGHFEYARRIYDQSRSSSEVKKSSALRAQIIESMAEYGMWTYVPWVPEDVTISQFHQPRLYYRLVAGILGITGVDDLIAQLYQMRLASALMGAIMVVVAFLTARALFPGDLFVPLGVAAFVLLLPMHSYMAGAVNNDSLANLWAALAIFFSVVALRRGLSLPLLILLGLTWIAGFYTKRTFFLAGPIILLAPILALILQPPRLLASRLTKLLVGLVAISAGAGLGMAGVSRGWWASLTHRLVYTSQRFDPGQMLLVLQRNGASYMRYLLKSFWGLFGWLNVPLSPIWYALLGVVSIGAVAGLFRLVRKRTLKDYQKTGLVIYGLAIPVAIFLTILTFLSYEVSPVSYAPKGAMPHGRYLFPVLIPIATLFVLGLRGWIPDHRRKIGLLVMVGFLGLIDFVALWGYIVPYFYSGATYFNPTGAQSEPPLDHHVYLSLVARHPNPDRATVTPTPTLTPTPSATPTPSPTMTPTATATAVTSVIPFGVQMLPETDDVENPTVINRAAEAGIRWVRITHFWQDPASFNWSALDTDLVDLAGAGLIPIVTVKGSHPATSEELVSFQAFMQAAAGRYDGDSDYDNDGDTDGPAMPQVEYWEMWNEPDSWSSWGGQGAAYAAMLKAAWTGVHTGNPNGKVVFGGLAYENVHWSICQDYPGGYCFDWNFVDTVLDTLQGESCFPCVDVWNYHFYRGLASNWSPLTVVGKGLHLRDRVQAYGLRDMPFVCTELGHPWAGTNPPDNDYSHETASRYVIQAFARTFSAPSQGLGLLVSIWFTMKEYQGGEGNWWGLLDSDAEPYPEYYAYQTVTRELAGTTYDRALDLSGIEGYVFQASEESPITVAWPTGASVVLDITGERVRQVDMLGNETMIEDGGVGDIDGVVNGVVALSLSPSPVFLQPR